MREELGAPRQRAAAAACFDDCRDGRHMDPENGVVSVCHRASECQGWRAYLAPTTDEGRGT